jgi:hypothetical protein
MIYSFIDCRDVVVNSCEFHTFSDLDSEGLVRGPSKAKNFFAAQPVELKSILILKRLKSTQLKSCEFHIFSLLESPCGFG